MAEASDWFASCLEVMAQRKPGSDVKEEIKNIKGQTQQMDDRFGTLDSELGSLDPKLDILLVLLQQNSDSN